MYSRVIPLEDLKQRPVMYWLPPRGRDNGVWADTWVMLAELEAGHIAAVLDLLAEADVGGYDAIPGGQKARANGCHHLYVDVMQYHRAEDVLMLFLRGKGPRPDGVGRYETDREKCDQAADHERRHRQGDRGAGSRRADSPGTGRRLLHRLRVSPHGAPRPAPRTGGDP